jgi:diguanylate cyclase (GGDEF)-like protein
MLPKDTRTTAAARVARRRVAMNDGDVGILFCRKEAQECASNGSPFSSVKPIVLTMRPPDILPLRQVSNTSNHEDDAVRQVTDDVLRWFRAMFEHAEPGPEHAEFDTRLQALTGALLKATDRQAIAQAGIPLTDTCRAAAIAVQRRQEARRLDVANLVSMVRETVDSLSDEHDASASALGESTVRLENLHCVTDFLELKERLAAEVVTLKRIATERAKHQNETIGQLKARLQNAEQQLCLARAEALIDALTEIPNRRAFDAELAKRIREAATTSPLVLALFEVDSFKSLNDRLGHPAGDAALRATASAIRDAVRNDDMVARIGGDEFAVIACGLTLARAEARMRALVRAIAAMPAEPVGAPISVSCGLSEFSAGDSVQTLLSRADAALSDAKALGKNRVLARFVPYVHALRGQRR